MNTQADIIVSRNVAKKVVKNLKLVESTKWQEDFSEADINGRIEDWIADQLLEYIEVNASDESSLIKINAMANNAQFSAIVANAFAGAYIETNIELRAQLNKQRLRWLEGQIESTQKRLLDSQRVLANFQQQHNIITVNGDMGFEKAQLIGLSQKLVENQARTQELKLKKEQLSLMVEQGKGNLQVQDVNRHSLTQNLKSDLVRAETRLSELGRRVVDNHPLYKLSQAEVLTLQRHLRSKVKNMLSSILREVDASQIKDEVLVIAIEEQKKKVLQLKKQGDELAVFNRKVENARHAYQKIMQTSAEIRIENEISQSNVAILNPAIPPQKPSSPRLELNLLMAIVFGIILGVCAAIIMELYNRRVRSPMDIYEALDIPVLAIISEKPERKSNVFLSFYQHKKQSSGKT